ncbi:hypothetical protein [Ulvibacterium sp.]|uniref:hypothetical protein n=1 Tax=Ulvibacterium sp. TaxID=2665914 RepID=UPI002636F800|nr:hypothetical protein [Ulvibacterium sp.]
MDNKDKPSFDKFPLDKLSQFKGFKAKNLELKSKKTLDLTTDSKTFKEHFKLVKVKDIAVVKELIGISDKIASKKNCGCPKISKIPSIKDLEVKDKRQRDANFAAARNIANRYIYGNSAEVSAYKPVLDRFLELSRATIPVFWFNDIIVHNNATLNIANDVLNVNARKIMLYGNGKITYTGPTTFNCRSFQGNL